MKRLIIALLCLGAVSAIVACKGYDDYGKNLKYEYVYTVKKHNVKGSDIEAIEQALDTIAKFSTLLLPQTSQVSMNLPVL